MTMIDNHANRRLRLMHPDRTVRNWQSNSRYHFAAGFGLSIYNSNSVYTHIPKNASSTMRYSIARANGLVDDDVDISWV